MAETVTLELSPFAADVFEGLSNSKQKQIPPRYFYDDLGSALFEAITLLPEYGLTRADERLLRRNARELAQIAGRLSAVAELGSGSGKKTSHILAALSTYNEGLRYCPIDVSQAALEACAKELAPLAQVEPVCADWLDGLRQIARTRTDSKPLLLLFLGSTIGNFERNSIPAFLKDLRRALAPGDLFLVGADLVKDVDRMVLAYDDPTGVTAAFNRNILARINRDLDADFDLRSFVHEARWNSAQRCIEMHLRCSRDQTIYIGALNAKFFFREGETIWTESSHKFTVDELHRYACSAGFTPVTTWVDSEWPFAEMLVSVPKSSRRRRN
ncbi:MAG TPA: L-histidine N(alpha)-methyltransferase [Bryobacteraceae bacterium]|jgi:dimethylhistidine N-methyltransferase|nr:L-histidine N(alpha)-methyltransferase [Bryobacteraceae bacterium]